MCPAHKSSQATDLNSCTAYATEINKIYTILYYKIIVTNADRKSKNTIKSKKIPIVSEFCSKKSKKNSTNQQRTCIIITHNSIDNWYCCHVMEKQLRLCNMKHQHRQVDGRAQCSLTGSAFDDDCTTRAKNAKCARKAVEHIELRRSLGKSVQCVIVSE